MSVLSWEYQRQILKFLNKVYIVDVDSCHWTEIKIFIFSMSLCSRIDYERETSDFSSKKIFVYGEFFG